MNPNYKDLYLKDEKKIAKLNRKLGEQKHWGDDFPWIEMFFTIFLCVCIISGAVVAIAIW